MLRARAIGGRDDDRNVAGCLDQATRQWQPATAVEDDPGGAARAGRAVNRGSSVSTGPIPTRIASIRPRRS
jgi:hypothetical protein